MQGIGEALNQVKARRKAAQQTWQTLQTWAECEIRRLPPTGGNNAPTPYFDEHQLGRIHQGFAEFQQYRAGSLSSALGGMREVMAADAAEAQAAAEAASTVPDHYAEEFGDSMNGVVRPCSGPSDCSSAVCVGECVGSVSLAVCVSTL